MPPETTQQLLDRSTAEAQKAAALIGGTYTQGSYSPTGQLQGGYVPPPGGYNPTITSANQAPQAPIIPQYPAPASSFPAANLNPEITTPAPIVLSPQETEISKRLKEIQAGITEASGRGTYQAQQEVAGGVPELQKLQRDLSSQLKLSQLEAANIQATPQRADIPTAIGARQKAEELRLNSVKSLQIYAQLQMAQGNLSTAQDAADRSTNLKFGPLEEANKAKLANLELMLKDPAINAAEKARAEASTLRIKQADEKIAQAKQDANDIWNDVYVKAVQNGLTDPTILAKITALREQTLTNPNAKYEAAQIAGSYLGNQDRTIKNLTIQEKQLAIQKAQNDLNSSNSLTAEISITGQRPSGVDSNKVDKATGLTPNAVFQAALGYALTGKSPALGLGTKAQVIAQRTAIYNTAGALLANAGVDLPTAQAEFKANQTSLNKILPLYNITKAAEGAASDNLDLALNQSGQVARTNAALPNRYLQWFQGNLTEAKGLTRFETYIYTASREYAKVTSGAAMSASGLTDSAAREAGKLLNATKSPGAFQAAVDAMKQDMLNVTGNYEDQIRNVSGVIGNILGIGDTVSHKGVTLPNATSTGNIFQGINLPF